MDDFDNFEFIDYTTSGPWERFITQIEDSLRSWGLVNGKLGVFDPAVFAVTEASDATVGAEPVKKQPAMTMAATSNIDKSDDEYSDNDTGEAGNNRGSSDSTNNNNNNNRSYQVREMLSLDDATYALSYHYHPAKARVAAGVERIDLEFLPISLEGVQHHSLHRWTSLTHILIISPVTISDIFASTMSSSSSTSMVIDLSSAKLLLSSFAIAFQNTGCSVPVFVPTGQPWNLTFTGLMIQPLIQPSAPDPSPDLSSSIAENEGTEWDEGCFEDDNYEQGVEVRFNTILVPYPPVQYTHLSGILDFFMERMGIEDCNPAASFTSGKYSRSLKEQIHTSALFCYDLVNWHDEDWRRWREGTGDKNVTKSTSNPNHETVFSSDNDEPILEAPDAAMNMDEIKTEDRNLSTLPIPVIPFGPIQDPLRSMRLFARFASMPCSVYLDNSNMADMDAGHANIWILQATFKEDSYGILSGILEDVISSWSSEAVGGERSEHKAGDGRAYGALLHKGARLIQGAISMVDAVEVENIVDTLFEGPPSPTPAATVQRPSSHPEIGANNHNIRLIPASELGLQFRHATTVPYNSFLWRMIQYLLDVVSPSSEVPYTTSAMGFIKVLWSELLKQFYSRWENSQLIPMVDIFGDGYTDDDKSSHKYNANQERKPVAIDLRYNLLHQKLSMLNCCIARQITCEKEAPRHIHPVLKRRKKKSKEQMVEDVELSQDNSHRHAVPGAQPIQNRTAQIQGLLHGLSNISRPRSADMVPTAKRLLESVKNRGAATFPQQQQQQCDQQDGAISPSSSATSSPTRPSTSQFTSKTEPSSPTAAVPIPKLETLGRRQSSSRQQSSDNDDDDEDVFYDPIVEDTTESLLDPYESQMQRRTLPMTESYVALKYSSSADSQSGVLVNDLDQSSVDVGGPDPREVADESKSEGGLMPLKDLKLLQTGAPLLIPKLQELGYMTEDMIKQQEEFFETLGSSSDGAKMRAKMQSVQLISDMEAFKAANPGCVLGDFIRWHSPKDWVEDKGEISARMADAGNYWQELWAHSKRIPVSRQTPLFNHNQEAAKVLFYLDNITPDQLFKQLLPTMCLIAYDILVSHPIALHIRQIAQDLKELAKDLTEFSWDELAGGNEDLNLRSILERFRETELLMSRAIALVRKFPEQYGLVEKILENQEAVVEDGQERECVYDLFSIGGSLQSSFPKPTSREFVLEAFDPDATETTASSKASPNYFSSRPLQRRMYACFKESEVRIVEAIAKDGLYM